MFESDADRLASIKAVGGELFDTGRAEQLWAIFDREFQEAALGDRMFESRVPALTCRSSDVAAHELVKGSAVRRLSNDSTFRVQRLEDDGTGMTIVKLSA